MENVDIDCNLFNDEIDVQKQAINEKIKNIEKKLLSLNNKESIINNQILSLNNELENTDPKHFKMVGQLRTSINRQLETLSLIIDMIVKFEDMIQRYRKMLIDIENTKFNNAFKIKKDLLKEEEAESDLSKVLEKINSVIDTNSITEESESKLIQGIKSELKEEGY